MTIKCALRKISVLIFWSIFMHTLSLLFIPERGSQAPQRDEKDKYFPYKRLQEIFLTAFEKMIFGKVEATSLMRSWSTISKPTPAGEQITMLTRKSVVNCCQAWIIKGWDWKGNWESSRNWKGGSGFFEISSSLCLWPPLEPGSRPDNGLGAVWHSAPLWRRLCVPLCPPLFCEPLPCFSNHIPNNQTSGPNPQIWHH